VENLKLEAIRFLSRT